MELLHCCVAEAAVNPLIDLMSYDLLLSEHYVLVSGPLPADDYTEVAVLLKEDT